MRRIKFSEKEKLLCRCLIGKIIIELRKKHPKIVRVDSNYFHFVIYRIAEKCKLNITRGWFKHGPYCWAVDDMLIEMGLMDKSQHQLYGDEKMLENWIECECHGSKI